MLQTHKKAHASRICKHELRHTLTPGPGMWARLQTRDQQGHWHLHRQQDANV